MRHKGKEGYFDLEFGIGDISTFGANLVIRICWFCWGSPHFWKFFFQSQQNIRKWEKQRDKQIKLEKRRKKLAPSQKIDSLFVKLRKKREEDKVEILRGGPDQRQRNFSCLGCCNVLRNHLFPLYISFVFFFNWMVFGEAMTFDGGYEVGSFGQAL